MKKVVDIVDYISRFALLKQVPSGEFVGLCPLHHEDTPSFFVNREKQQFVCMGCRAGGDIITFIQLYHKVSFEKAIEILQFESGVSPRAESGLIKEVKKFKPIDGEYRSNRLYLKNECMHEFSPSHEIIEWIREGISADVLEKYDVRYGADKKKIYFPIWDINNRIISIKYRDLYGTPKYKYTNKIGKKDFLYNLNFAYDAIVGSSECILFEGEKSVMKMETWGIHNSVAVGTHYIKDEVQLLIRIPFDNLVFAYDSDVPLKEIYSQISILRHFKNVYYIPTKLLGDKEAPCDKGKEFFEKLYESRVKIK